MDVDWQTHDSLTVMTVRNALLKVHRAISLLEYEKYFLQDGVTFNNIVVVNSGHDAGQIGRPGSSDPGSFAVLTGNLEWKPLEIKSFSRKPEDFPFWKEHVEFVFTKFAAYSFLTSMQACKESPERSNSCVCSLREALKDSIISAATDKHKNKTCYEFWSVILSCFNSAVLQHLKCLKVGTAPSHTAAMQCWILPSTRTTLTSALPLRHVSSCLTPLAVLLSLTVVPQLVLLLPLDLLVAIKIELKINHGRFHHSLRISRISWRLMRSNCSRVGAHKSTVASMAIMIRLALTPSRFMLIPRASGTHIRSHH